ncbi:phosphatidylinositol polyphosphate 5-phosphatase type IV-like [Lytechinus variegatus]|uniref:phosphatidylinositol polyphosphate 5-phosphatase type IV-like n=1 Tax=Lytechinus variegatus TaxID=7654 RepID=UPI001BB29941|nr:phosphatidylinositol polyphosphate 5-phosphatase type IV-like [Lytechinus variegatus]
MDIGDLEPLSARSTSSVEDGSSSTRSKKSKTLARLRKLKKSDSSSRDSLKDALLPHPPDSQSKDDLTDRRLSNGLLDGGSALPDDIKQSAKVEGERIIDTITRDSQGMATSLDPLRPKPSDWGEKSPLKSSLFPSPLDPVHPASRGLGALEPLAPRGVLEPLEKPKRTFSVKPEESIGRVGIGTNGDSKYDTSEIKETVNDAPTQRGDVFRIDGVVETETSDSQNFSAIADKNSVQENEFGSLSSVKNHLPSELKQMEDTLSKPSDVLEDDDDALDVLPDEGKSNKLRSDVLVSSAIKDRTGFSTSFSNSANKHALTGENHESIVSSRLQDNDAFNKIEEHPVKPKTTVTLIEEDDDESDDELIVVSPLVPLSKPRTDSVPPRIEGNLMGDHLEESEGEVELPNRTVPDQSDGNEDIDDDKEDEENLKQYLKDKLQHIEDSEDSDALVASPSNSSRAGRLSPITNASVPPPLPNTIMSPSLRTSYKRDNDLEDSFGNSEISDAVLSSGSISETNRSMASSSLLLNTLTNKGARSGNMSYLSGGVRNSGSLVGKDELDSHLPERRLRIFVATWNMHEDKEIPENLDDLLLPEDIEYMQDVYVIGTQESSPDIAEWEIRLQETLGPSHVLLHSAAHGVLHCLVFIRRDLIWFCSPVEESRVSTRPGSMIKTKGAIAVSFNFFGTSFIFIVSHFTSGDENMKERLLDYEKILKGISLPEKVPPTRKFNILTSDVTTRFDYVFWCGDFNFRLAENKARVEGWIDQLKRGNKNDYDILLQHDQLNKAMQRNEIFQGFHEGKINFLPTYKFDIGEDIYDTSTKARVPSYTDRVLYKSRRVTDISLIHYSSCEEIKTSDHRPVYGVFEAGIRPGKENSVMGGGMFVREVYIEGIKRRVAKSGMSKRTQAGSSVCSVM